MSWAQGDRESREFQEFFGSCKKGGGGRGVSHAENRCPALGPGRDKPTVLEAREVFGDRGLRQPQVLGQLNNSVVAQQEVLKNHQACTVAESVEQASGRRQ